MEKRYSTMKMMKLALHEYLHADICAIHSLCFDD